MERRILAMLPLVPVFLVLAPEALPALFPKDLPLPPGARIVQVLDQSRARAGAQSVGVQFRSELATRKVLDFYLDALRRGGREARDLSSLGAPIVTGHLGTFECTVTVMEGLGVVTVVAKPEGGTFAAFHEEASAGRKASAPVAVKPLDLASWRLSGAACPGDYEPGALLLRQGDGTVLGFGMGLVHRQARLDPDRHGQWYCGQDDPPMAPSRIFEGARLAVAAPGAPQGAIFVIDRSGTLHSFGSDCGGRLGQGVGDATNRWFDPKPILAGVREVVAGGANTAAITEAGALYVWGSNLSGQVPGCKESFAKTPVKVLDGVVSVAVARDSVYAVKGDGTLWGWGEAQGNGFLDGGVVKVRKAPYLVMEGVRAVFSVDVGPVAVIKADGSLWTWGHNGKGQCGSGQGAVEARPARIADHVARVALANHHGALLREDGTVWTWGRNFFGQCGFPRTEVQINQPRKVAEDAVDVAVTGGETYVLKKDGSLWGCGHNTKGLALQGRGGVAQGQLLDTGIRVP